MWGANLHPNPRPFSRSRTERKAEQKAAHAQGFIPLESFPDVASLPCLPVPQIALVVWMFQYPVRTAAAVGLCMAQIGEFAFVLLSAASQHGLLPYQVYMLLMGEAPIVLCCESPTFLSAAPDQHAARLRLRSCCAAFASRAACRVALLAQGQGCAAAFYRAWRVVAGSDKGIVQSVLQ